MNIVKPGYEFYTPSGYAYQDILKHIEHCGRVCYKSESKITGDSAEKFVNALIKRGHTSVLEHGNLIFECEAPAHLFWREVVTTLKLNGIPSYIRFTYTGDHPIVSGNIRAFRDSLKTYYRIYKGGIPKGIGKYLKEEFPVFFADCFDDDDLYGKPNDKYHKSMRQTDPNSLTGREQLVHCTQTIKFIVDRGISHELVRHRTLSPSQESTRYCNYSADQFGGNITVIEPCYLVPNTPPYRIWKNSCTFAETAYFDLLDCGCSPQEARGVLPTALKTEVVLTGTLEEWHKFFELRTPKGVHPQMREVVVPLLKDVKHKHPTFFRDIEV